MSKNLSQTHGWLATIQKRAEVLIHQDSEGKQDGIIM
jgi:hypothetical protein